MPDQPASAEWEALVDALEVAACAWETSGESHEVLKAALLAARAALTAHVAALTGKFLVLDRLYQSAQRDARELLDEAEKSQQRIAALEARLAEAERDTVRFQAAADRGMELAIQFGADRQKAYDAIYQPQGALAARPAGDCTCPKREGYRGEMSNEWATDCPVHAPSPPGPAGEGEG